MGLNRSYAALDSVTTWGAATLLELELNRTEGRGERDLRASFWVHEYDREYVLIAIAGTGTPGLDR